ncbi:MAG: hypothetical protein LBE92_10750 [Chryseobacterium sp.]|jgi:hypothetical protein|uniref:hypothetical protein n=1 Tax=Chryseobacterium sp. TaxID=1871047 RepID=UPI00282AF62D|nr:hypothetical protein [Chryseobacterium sp.]MDR2236594.1 hypothetical protein [Chryseobacterium sp.]
MEIKYLEYKVRNGDTLKSVASRLGMTGEELKLFHNSHCQKMDWVWFENLNEVKMLLVPTHFQTEKEKEQERKNRLPSAVLSDSFFAKTYDVWEAIEGSFQPDVKMNYTIDLNLRKDQMLLTYAQKDFKSDGNIPGDKVSDLSMACMKSIMPIDFTLDHQGRICGFSDHKKITAIFAGQRKELEDFYTGEITKKYVDSFEHNILDERFLLQQFQSTLLFQTLFPEMKWFHRKTSWTEVFYFFQNSFPVQCHMEIEQENEDDHLLITTLKGKITDWCSSREILWGIRPDEMSSGDFTLKYTTHKKNKNLLHAKASLILKYEEESIHQHNITITQR